ncbi:TPA: sodium:proton antiporter [Candidatus Gracilibacteria bacterium]|nr:sodium:proton antiporter [Candidatus Peregrinibacteria bacterium]HIQ56431.1 sodium:proton antiporter [Candidatus Gracilibacteria bacterium]HIQ57606.1 sodium:proton antiporter [Candidatus Gracilibacteria bacterium]
MDSFALTIVAACIFLLIASFSLKPSNKYNIPHSVLLVFLGILLAFVIKQCPSLAFLGEFQLSPELIFFVFLPTLLFESAFKFPLRKLVEYSVPILLLSIFGYLLSVGLITSIIWIICTLLSISFPILAILLFAVIISATDPVAVLSIFKKLGVTPRLTYLFEGESLFNDGTSYAMFVILIGFLTHSAGNLDLFHLDIAILQFVVMFIGGILFGVFMGYAFMWLISKVKTEETIQLTLSLVMANLTFLLADLSKHFLHIGGHEFEFSAIIATVMASIILGSRGIQKFDSSVRAHMDILWEHFAFIANSLIFILIGMLTVQVMTVPNITELWFIILLAIVSVIFARIISIYLPLNIFNLFTREDRKISKDWMKILSWGSLRGAIAIASLLMIPDNLAIPHWTLEISPKDAIITLVIACILFTTFVKAVTLEYFVEKMQLAKFSHIETLETLEGKILTITMLLEKIEQLRDKKYISRKNFARFVKEYKSSKKHSIRKIANFFIKDVDEENIKTFLHLHALTIEKKILQTLIDHHEISEQTYWTLFDKLIKQEARLKGGAKQIQGPYIDLGKIAEEEIPLRYQMTRARTVILKKVLRRLEEFACPDLCIPKNAINIVIAQYKKWSQKAEDDNAHLLEKYPKICRKGEYAIIGEYIKDLEQEYIKQLEEKSILNAKVSKYLQSTGLK